jgi:hypothetical protein
MIPFFDVSRSHLAIPFLMADMAQDRLGRAPKLMIRIMALSRIGHAPSNSICQDKHGKQLNLGV